MKFNIKDKLTSFNKKLEKVLVYLENNPKQTLFIFLMISLLIRIVLTDYGSLLRKDDYVYLLKALEITEGNFIPVKSHAIGLPLFTSIFFYFIKSASIFQNMIYAKIISNIIGTLIIIPFFFICKALLNKRQLIIALVLFAFYAPLILSSVSFVTEPLFTFIFLFSVFFLIRSKENSRFVLLSAVFAALSYYVRPTGLFSLVIVLVSFFMIRFKTLKKDYKYLIFSIIIFFLIASPILVQRAVVFGSPTTFGENDKYFLDDYREVWSENIQPISLSGYLKTHTFFEAFNKFIIKGLFTVIFYYFHGMDGYNYSPIVLPILIFFFLLGFVKNFYKKDFLPLTISFVVYTLALSIVFSVFAGFRHLEVLVPFIIIFSSISIQEIFNNKKLANVLLALFLLVFIVFSLLLPGGYFVLGKATMPNWVTWASKNLQGNIVINEGGDLIMMNFPDSSAAGMNSPDIFSKDNNISVSRPGYFNDLKSALKYFKENKINFIVLDVNRDTRGQESLSRDRPYLEEIYEPEYKALFNEVYSNVNSTDSWKVRIFKINWSNYS